MQKKYCYFCNDLVDYKVKAEKCEYSYRNKNFIIKEDKYYCVNCQNELGSEDLDSDLKKIYNGYLNLFNLSLDSFKEIRNDLGLSQELFALGLNWSKKSVIRYENFLEIPSGEYLKTYKMLKEDKDYFLECLYLNKNNIEEDMYYKIINKMKLGVDYKSRNVIIYLLKDKAMTVMQLLKCLFAIDFLSYKNNSRSITNFKYAKLQFGPVVDGYKNVLMAIIKSNEVKYGDGIDFNGDIKMTYIANINPDMKCFKEEEIKIMAEVKRKLANKSATYLSNWSHNFKGWIDTSIGNIIDYEKYAQYFEL